MGCGYRETEFIRYEDEKEKINQHFDSGLWSHAPTRNWIYDPYTITDGSHLLLPTGKHAEFEKVTDWDDWYVKLGVDPSMSKYDPKFRMRFNALSILFAGRHQDLDIYSPNGATLNMPLMRVITNIEKKGLKLSSRDPGELAKLLGGQESQEILVGMRMIIMRNANRLEDAMDSEPDGEIDKEVTALSQTVFTQAHVMAKLLDPTLRASPKVQIGIAGASQVSIDGTPMGGSPEGEIASALKELTSQGVPLKDITDQILLDYMDARVNGDTRAIAAVINNNTIDAASPF